MRLTQYTRLRASRLIETHQKPASRASRVRNTRHVRRLSCRKTETRAETRDNSGSSRVSHPQMKVREATERPLNACENEFLSCGQLSDRCMCNADNTASSAVRSYVRDFAAGHVSKYWKILNGCVLSGAFVGPFSNMYARLFSFV